MIAEWKATVLAPIGPGIKAAEVKAESLSALEIAVKHRLHEVGNEGMRQWLEAQEDRSPAEVERGGCGQAASGR